MARAIPMRSETRRLVPAVGPAALVLVAVLLLAGGCGLLTRPVQNSDRPNVVLILADDLDVNPLQRHGERYPNLRRLADEGTTFENAFVTDPLCCPSRATLLRGQYSHNHGIVGNWRPLGGAGKFRDLGREDSTVATWLQGEGYRTALVGKYMNDYRGDHVPAGWDDWYGISGGHKSHDLNENGWIRHYDPLAHHPDDVLADKAAGTLRPPEDGSPFFMWVGTRAPHAPADPAPRHEDAFPGARLPRPPSFDEGDVSDKPDWVRDNPQLERGEIPAMQDLYRNRLRSMLAVDDMVGRLVDVLEETGELDNTYVFFTSDNGWHAGEHRLNTGKWTAYEEDIRVPLIVSGPGVPEGETLPHMVLNNDLAPTFADLAGAAPPGFVDGRSLTPLLKDDPPPDEDWRSAFLVEAATELGPTAVLPLSGDPLPENWRRVPREYWGRPGLEAVRTMNHLYVEYGDGGRELYDLREDPHQLDNLYETADSGPLRTLRERLAALRDCAGEGCRAAEEGPG
ncbi:MAG: Putative sulfatase [uncultured Rubrobacteraceae bacterium]|uniref:Sulfatase n=1 Tax=uncultured Rubrobacteraceae bacterium TaxID=349277 RepID=A0A6J4TCA1_9ACTN|nr:MAG: Putative sulfatase [uncultured Rubrobacteraceae bacterium]